MKKLLFTFFTIAAFTQLKAEIVHVTVDETCEFGDGFETGSIVNLSVDGTEITFAYTDFQGIHLSDPTWMEDIILTNSTPDVYTDEIKFFEEGDAVDDSYFVNVDGWTGAIMTPGEEPGGVHFFGFKTVSGKFGWIKIDMIPGESYKVIEYAYENTAGMAINAGQTETDGGGDASIINSDKVSISLFPNPVQNQLNITGIQLAEISKVEVYDLFGKKVLESSLMDSSVDVSTLETGVYVLHVTLDSRQIITGKFTKAK